VITKLAEQWKAEASAFMQRDLSGTDYVYAWADGIHVNIRLEEARLCLLVMIEGPHRRPQGAHRPRRRVPGVRRVMG
jgi:hypothetical protein